MLSAKFKIMYNNVMSKLFTKFIFSFLAFLILTFSVAPNFLIAKAQQGTWYNSSFGEFVSKVYDDKNPADIFGERYTAAQVQWVFYSLGSLLISITTLGLNKAITCNVDPVCWGKVVGDAVKIIETIKGADGSGVTGGGTGSLNLIPSLATTIGKSPISGISYTKNLIAKFNPVTTVNAQGFGFTTGANAVQKLWQVSRNICFALLTLIIVIFAFMIMFRVKINPQTVITVQSALPKLFGALILITFSYAIAGFAIDLMYVVIGLMASFISGSGLSSHNAAQLFDSFTVGENAIGLVFEFWLAFMLTALYSIFSSFNPLTWIGGILLLIFAILVGIVSLIFAIKIIVLIFKTFANVVLTIVTGPIEILLGTVMPGMGFGPWFRKLMGHLIVYPLMGLMFFLAFFFLAQSINVGLFGAIGSLGDDFVNIFPFNPNRTLIGGNSWDPPLSVWAVTGDALLWAIVGYVIFTMIPKTVEIVQGFMSGRPFAYGSAVGESTVPLKGYGLYGTTSLAQGQWPAPLNWIPGIGMRRAPDGTMVSTQPPVWLKNTADALREPLNTVTKVTRG